jgi:hypothetical protein
LTNNILPKEGRLLKHFLTPIFLPIFDQSKRCHNLQRLHDSINDIGIDRKEASFPHCLPDI